MAYEEALQLEGAIDAAVAAKFTSNETRTRAVLESPRTSRARAVRNIWAKSWDTWAALVAKYGNCEGKNGFERFESGNASLDLILCIPYVFVGYVLTRVIYKSAEALAQLGEHELEIEVLKALLAQKRWRKTRRGLVLVYV